MMLALSAIWGGSSFFAEIAPREVPPLTITLHGVVRALPLLLLVVHLRGISVARAPRVWGAAFLGEALARSAYLGLAVIAEEILVTDGRLAARLRRA